MSFSLNMRRFRTQTYQSNEKDAALISVDYSDELHGMGWCKQHYYSENRIHQSGRAGLFVGLDIPV